MYVIKNMQLNKFEKRPIVSNRELFASNGKAEAVVTSKAMSDCLDDPQIDGASKTKMLGLASAIVAQAEKEHNTAGNTSPMQKKNAKEY